MSGNKLPDAFHLPQTTFPRLERHGRGSIEDRATPQGEVVSLRVSSCQPRIHDVESRLISIILNRHPRREIALDEILSDIGLPARRSQEFPRPVAGRETTAQELEKEDPERWSGLE